MQWAGGIHPGTDVEFYAPRAVLERDVCAVGAGLDLCRVHQLFHQQNPASSLVVGRHLAPGAVVLDREVQLLAIVVPDEFDRSLRFSVSVFDRVVAGLAYRENDLGGLVRVETAPVEPAAQAPSDPG